MSLDGVVRFGMVGTGFIAGVMADRAFGGSAPLVAVSSRSLARAEAFRPGVAGVEGAEALAARDDVDAVYVATPTAAKEAAAMAAIAAGKHVLVDKPFAGAASARRMREAAKARGVCFVDATHFVHHPRTEAIRGEECVGEPRTLHTCFYFPAPEDPSAYNIRGDASAEPQGALGDMGWYSARAMVEYLRPAAPPLRVEAAAERDTAGAVVRVTGVAVFADALASTFDAGYTAGTLLQDLSLLGTKGAAFLDDFVLDASHPLVASSAPVGYTVRTGMEAARQFRATPCNDNAERLMVQRVAALALAGAEGAAEADRLAERTVLTQTIVDMMWEAATA